MDMMEMALAKILKAEEDGIGCDEKTELLAEIRMLYQQKRDISARITELVVKLNDIDDMEVYSRD